jgi:hypothetical protein
MLSFSEMTWIDFLIIYLAVGAAFGVYFFLKNREYFSLFFLFLYSIFVVCGWVWFAAELIWRRIFSYSAAARAEAAGWQCECEVKRAAEDLQRAFAAVRNQNTEFFFEFREIIDRYVGLSLAAQGDAGATEAEMEFFRAAGRSRREVPIAAEILHRRNLLRLETHRIAARQDFLQACGKLAAHERLQTEARRLAILLKDTEAVRALQQISNNKSEHNEFSERDLWKIYQPAATLKTMPNVRTTTATKD